MTEKLRVIFSKFRNNSLKLQQHKLNFLKKKVSFLGHKLSENGVQLDDSRIKWVKMIAESKNTTDTRYF